MTSKWFSVTLKEEYEKQKRLKKEMVSEVKESVENKPYLPQNISDVELVHHIQSCDFDVDYAKRALDVNYTVRSKAEFFKNRDPFSQEAYDSLQCFALTFLVDLDNNGNHAILGRLQDFDSSKYNFDNVIRTTTMLLDYIRLEHGTTTGFAAIMDMTGFTLSHLLKIPFGSLRHFMRYLQEGSPTKMTSLHLINTQGSIIDKVMILLRPLLSERITNVMHFHPGYETLYDHGFKQSKLPVEYGGSAGTTQELADDSFNQLKAYAEYFKEEAKQRIDESKRPRTKYFGFF